MSPSGHPRFTFLHGLDQLIRSLSPAHPDTLPAVEHVQPHPSGGQGRVIDGQDFGAVELHGQPLPRGLGLQAVADAVAQQQRDTGQDAAGGIEDAVLELEDPRQPQDD